MHPAGPAQTNTQLSDNHSQVKQTSPETPQATWAKLSRGHAVRPVCGCSSWRHSSPHKMKHFQLSAWNLYNQASLHPTFPAGTIIRPLFVLELSEPTGLTRPQDKRKKKTHCFAVLKLICWSTVCKISICCYRAQLLISAPWLLCNQSHPQSLLLLSLTYSHCLLYHNRCFDTPYY